MAHYLYLEYISNCCLHNVDQFSRCQSVIHESDKYLHHEQNEQSNQRPVSLWRCNFTTVGIPITMIWLWWDHFIFITWIWKLGKKEKKSLDIATYPSMPTHVLHEALCRPWCPPYVATRWRNPTCCGNPPDATPPQSQLQEKTIL